MARTSVRIGITIGLLLVSCLEARAQAVYRAEARVTYLAGPNVYLDAGRAQGILPGDTLAVERGGAVAGRFVVVSSIDDRSVVTFADDPFPVAQGETLVLRVPRPPEAPPAEERAPPAEPPAPAGDDAGAPAARPPVRTPPKTREGPRLAGRLQLSLNTLRSATDWGGTTTERTFATPSLGLHLRAEDLPGGLALRTRLRADYRYTSGRDIDPTASVRTYELLVEKAFDRVAVQAGRFPNRYAPFDGYWDGALVHVGSRALGVGTAIGFLPDRANEGFSAEMPRYGGFAHAEVGDPRTLEYEVQAAVNEVRPTNRLLTHRFASLSQRVRSRGFTFRNDVQVDRDPEQGGWVVSRFTVRGAAVPHPALSLHARYQLRRPYSIWRVVRVVSYRRDQATAGAVLRLDALTLGADAAFNFAEDDDGALTNDGRTLSGYLHAPRTVAGLALSVNASRWQDGDGSSLFVTTGLARDLGPARARVQYQFYRTEVRATPFVTHAASVYAAVPLGRRISASGQVRLQQGRTLRSAAFFASLWYSF